MPLFLGDLAVDTMVSIPFSTHEAAGGNVAPSNAFEIADIRIYRGSSAAQRSSSSGMTMTSPFDSLTGVHMVEIDTSDDTDTGFFASGYLYHVMLAPDTETVDGQTLTGVHLASFGIEYGGAHWQLATIILNIGSPSDLGSGASVAANLADIESQTDDIGAAGAGLTALATAANLATVSTNVDSILADTGTDGVVLANNAITNAKIASGAIGADELAADVITDIWQGTALTEAYAVDGAAATPAQLLHMIWAMLAEKSVSGTTLTVKKLDGSTSAMTFTLNDASNPTSITRAT